MLISNSLRRLKEMVGLRGCFYASRARGEEEERRVEEEIERQSKTKDEGYDTLADSPMEASLCGFVKVQSASSVGQWISLQKAEEKGEGHDHLYYERIQMILKRLLFRRGSFFWKGGGVNAFFDVAVRWQNFRSGEKNGGIKSHDHEKQRVSKTAAKTARNSVKCPGN